MAEELVMTKDATPKKAAFMSKPYSKEEKIKKEEEELKKLIDEQKKETSSEKEEEAVEDKEPDNAEGKNI